MAILDVSLTGMLIGVTSGGVASPDLATLDVSPSRVAANQTRTVTFIGSGTTWLSGAPDFSVAGVSGISVDAVTVVSDTVATASVTYGADTGTAVWTDSTTSQARNQLVGQMLKMIWGNRYRRA